MPTTHRQSMSAPVPPMTEMTPMKKTTTISMLSLMLTACGGAPSDNEIKEALLADQAKAVAAAETEARAWGGGTSKMLMGMIADSKINIVSARKVGCKEDGEKAYRCDVELETKRGETITKSPPASLRFVKGSEGWVAQR